MTPRSRRVTGTVGIVAAVGILGTLAYAIVDGLQGVAAGDGGLMGRLGDALYLFLSPSTLLMLAMGLFLLTTGIRLRRPVNGDAGTRGTPARDGDVADTAGAENPAVKAPVPVPPEELELEEMNVTACLRCGSVHVAPLTMSDGMFVMGGETLAWVCRRCNWRGAPLTFDDPTAYRAFVKGLHEETDETITLVESSRGESGVRP